MNGHQVASKIRQRVSDDVVGHGDVVELIIACLAARRHVLLEGPPGVAKTLVARKAARAMGLDFKRIQMTPDLMPGDLLGTNVWLPAEGRFDFREGPVFTDVLLADEINRAPPKTQAALLQAMQEHSVTLDGVDRDLGRDFWVLATQNPLDQEGTYPLPESQLDRFALKVQLAFPDAADELRILERHRQQGDALERVQSNDEAALERSELNVLHESVAQVHVAQSVLEYMQTVVAMTRDQREFLMGAGPRAALSLLDVGRALAMIRGRDYLIPDDIRDLYSPCLAHRVRLAPEAMISGVSVDEILERILKGVPVPESHSA